MRRTTLLALRTLIVLLLAGAVLDVQIPGSNRSRVRYHLVDRSGSVRIQGPRESLDLKDVDDIIARDRDVRGPHDTIGMASFGRTVVFESKEVDPSGTDLAGALSAVLGRNPTEIVLYTDGRGDPGPSLFLCRERHVPIHVIPLGPTSVSDARITRIEAPAEAPEGSPVPIAVTVESTVAMKTRVRVDAEGRDADLAPRVPLRLTFTLPRPGKFKVDLDAKDDCAENNHAEGEVFVSGAQQRVLLLSSRTPEISGFTNTRATSLTNPENYDAVIVDDVLLPSEAQERLATYARNGGGVLLIGPQTAGISPFQPRPDLRVAVVLGVDASGSMNAEGRWELAIDAVNEASKAFDADDPVVVMTFGDEARILGNVDELRKIHPTGGTRIARGIAEARRFLASRQAGRRHIVLVTDGEVSSDEPATERKNEFDQLKDIGLTILTTDRKVDVGDNIMINGWKDLRGRLNNVVGGLQELERQNPGTIDYRDHPATKGAPRVPLAHLYRRTPKLDAQIAATVGQAPALDFVLAFRQEGQGRVGAFAIPYDPRLEVLFRQSLKYVAGDTDAGLTLSIDPPLVRARGTNREPHFETSITRVELNQAGSNLWEGRLPDGLTGTALVRKGRARAAATIPCPPEYQALGLDRPALDRIARATGGRVLSSTAELDHLPRPSTPEPHSGRTVFLIGALILVFAEMAVSTFWKL